MSWSYSPAIGSDRDWVRLRIADTSSGDQLLSNEAIDFLLAEAGNRDLAAYWASESVLATLSREADTKVGPLSIAASKRADAYAKVVKGLKARIGASVAPYAGGISRADIEAVESDTDRVPADFAVGSMDTPGTRTSAEDKRLGDV